MKKYILVILMFVGFSFTNQLNANNPKTITEAVKNLTETLDEDYILFIKNTPYFDLIYFHRSLGMNIRNDFGLWGDNAELLESCANKLKKKNIHPEDASQLIITELWLKLNSEVVFVDYDKLNPNQYFHSIAKAIKAYSISKRINDLVLLPSWVFENKNIRKSSSVRIKELESEAYKLSLSNSSVSNLALLYLSKFTNNNEFVETQLKEKDISSSKVVLNVPNYTLIRASKIEKFKINYNLIPLKAKDLILNCNSSLYNKYFKDYNELLQWKTILKSNLLLQWKYRNKDVTNDEFKELVNNSKLLLEILLLTKSYTRKDVHNSEMFVECNNKNSIKSKLLKHFNITDKVYDISPYDKKINVFYNGDNYLNLLKGEEIRRLNEEFKSIHVIKRIVDNMQLDDIVELLRIKTTEDYNNNRKTEGLLEYKYLVAFVLATQKKRLLTILDEEELFSIINKANDYNFVSWSFKYYLIDLMFILNKKKTNNMFKYLFDEDKIKGSFTRHQVIKSKIKNDLNSNKELLYNWYFIVQDMDLKHMPREYDVLLRALKTTSDDSKKLLTRIIKDKRFNKMEFLKTIKN